MALLQQDPALAFCILHVLYNSQQVRVVFYSQHNKTINKQCFTTRLDMALRVYKQCMWDVQAGHSLRAINNPHSFTHSSIVISQRFNGSASFFLNLKCCGVLTMLRHSNNLTM